MRRNPSSSRSKTDLDLRAPGALAALFARNRAEFGGHRMELDTAAPAAPTDYLDRLNRAAGDHLAKIGEIVERAKADGDRELKPEEIAESEQEQAAYDGLQPQIERWSKIREANVAHVERSAMAPAPAPITRVEVVERSADHIADGPDGQPIFRSAGQAAAALIDARKGDQAAVEQVARAIQHQKTSNTPGLLPIPTIGGLRNTLFAPRRLVPTMTQLPLPPAGLEMKRPRITTHTVVGKQGGTTANTAAMQAAEKTDLPSQAMQIDFDTYRISTFGGAVNISIQDVERTDPGALELVYADLAQQYGIATEAEAAAVLVAGAVTAGTKTTLAANADLPTLWKAVFAGAGTILGASGGRMPTDLYASVDQWARIGGATTPINGQNQVASAVPTDLQAVLGNINVTVVPALPAGTLILGRRDALEYVENGQEPIRLSVPEPRLLGYEIAVYGYFAAWVALPGAFTYFAA